MYLVHCATSCDDVSRANHVHDASDAVSVIDFRCFGYTRRHHNVFSETSTATLILTSSPYVLNGAVYAMRHTHQRSLFCSLVAQTWSAQVVVHYRLEMLEEDLRMALPVLPGSLLAAAVRGSASSSDYCHIRFAVGCSCAATVVEAQVRAVVLVPEVAGSWDMAEHIAALDCQSFDNILVLPCFFSSWCVNRRETVDAVGQAL